MTAVWAGPSPVMAVLAVSAVLAALAGRAETVKMAQPRLPPAALAAMVVKPVTVGLAVLAGQEVAAAQRWGQAVPGLTAMVGPAARAEMLGRRVTADSAEPATPVTTLVGWAVGAVMPAASGPAAPAGPLAPGALAEWPVATALSVPRSLVGPEAMAVPASTVPP